MPKVFRTGTHRVRLPEHTWELIEPLLPRYGITRVADVTGLDVLGVPVAMATRPLAKTLSVSQGKGQTLLLAKVSAAMESLEFWHAEYHGPRVAHRQVAARDLGLPYRIEQLCSSPDALITENTPLDWVAATGMTTGKVVPVPADLVTAPTDDTWSPPGLEWSTNGLASGNNFEEACVHALYELIERDAVSRRISGAPNEYVRPDSITDPHCADIVERITSSGATLRITKVPTRFDVPVFGATVWSPDFPLICLGWGAHLDENVAVSRAVTESAQSRLTTIAGSRDDIGEVYDIMRASTDEPAPVDGPVRSWDELEPVGPGAFDEIGDELSWLVAEVDKVAGTEPLCVDLSTVPEFAVAKVVAPGVAFDYGRVHTDR